MSGSEGGPRKRAEPKGRHRASVRPNHHFASLLIAGSCSVKVVQKTLGHASARETLDTYGHLWPDSDDLTRQAVDSALGILAASTRPTAAVAP